MIDLNYKSFASEGPHLIVIHGLLGSSDNWNTLAKEFSSAFHVHALDMRNHGRSPHTASHTYKLMSEDVLHHIEKHLDGRPVHLLGHSMGGKVVLDFAHRYPLLAKSAIVADMGLRAYPRGHDHIFAALRSLDLSHLTSRKDAAEQLENFITDPSIVQFLLKNLGRATEGFYWKFNLTTLYKDYEHVLSSLDIDATWELPTLFVKGAMSSYISDDDIAHINRLFSDVRIDVIPEAGHWVHADNPERFLALCKNFWESGVVD